MDTADVIDSTMRLLRVSREQLALNHAAVHGLYDALERTRQIIRETRGRIHRTDQLLESFGPLCGQIPAETETMRSSPVIPSPRAEYPAPSGDVRVP